MSFREGLTEEEEEQHVKRGAWLALPLLPLLLLCVCGICAITPGGRRGLSEVMVLYARDGVPYLADYQISYTRGFTGVAKTSCDLEQQSPKPGNYQAAQQQLEQEYTTLVKYYKDYRNQLRKQGGDVEPYEPPEDIPSDLRSARFQYCR